MADTGWVLPQTGANVTKPDGVITWSNPGNICTTGGATATGAKNITHWLRGTNFDFSSIPVGATINGIECAINRYGNGVNYGSDAGLTLVLAGTAQGTDHISFDYWPTTYGEKVYGSSSDMWGTALTLANIQTSTFGVQLAASLWNAAGTLYVDYFKLKIYYTAASGQPLKNPFNRPFRGVFR